MAVEQSSAREIDSLTSIRGLAAFWVVVLHFAVLMYGVLPESHFLAPLISAGTFAVPLFFVLSGYVLGLRYLNKLASPTSRTIMRFWWLRLGRVYPVHICTLAVYLVVFARNGWPTAPGLTREEFISNCFLTHAWDYHFLISWNYPAWSISSEWFAYLIFPLVAMTVSRLGRRGAKTLTVVACVASAAVYAFEDLLVFEGLAVVVPTFIGGCLLSVVCAPGSCAQAKRWADLGLVIAVAMPFVFVAGPGLKALYLVLIFGMVAALGLAGNQASAVWRSRWLIYLGEISYSLYMTHAIAINFLTRAISFDSFQHRSLIVRTGLVAGSLAFICVVSVICYYLIERPMRNWSRRLASPQSVKRMPEDAPSSATLSMAKALPAGSPK